MGDIFRQDMLYLIKFMVNTKLHVHSMLLLQISQFNFIFSVQNKYFVRITKQVNLCTYVLGCGVCMFY